jgi:hypothetical protein
MAVGSGLAAVLRPGRRSGWLFSGRRSAKGSALAGDGGLAAALRRYRLELVGRWPEATEGLVRGRFDPAVRSVDTPTATAGRFEEQLSSLWDRAIEREVDAMARRLGGAWLQILMNAPVLGILGYVGWVTVKTFFSGDYLLGDYFLHAFWVIAIALLLSFFALQVLIRLTASPDRIMARALDRLQKEVADMDGLAGHPLCVQLEAVLRMAAAASGGYKRLHNPV